MNLLSRIVAWLSDHEAAISAVAAIIVIGGVILAGLRLLLRRRREAAPEMAPSAPTEPAPAAEAPVADLDPLTVPGFEGRPAVAVLPFDNMSGDPDQEYFADGIAEDLITQLSTWRDCPVIARNSSFTYKGKPVDVKQVSRELGVRYVVEGSVRKVGDRVRISAQLIDATTGAHVWAETYDRELRGIFALQDEISEAIVASMHPELFHAEQKRAGRRELGGFSAWEYAQRGWWHWSKFTRDDNRKARDFFEKAAELEPPFVNAFLGLGSTYYMELLHQWTQSPDQCTAELVRFARRCVEIDDNDPWGQWLLGVTHRITGQHGKAIAAFERATQLSPSFAAGYHDLGVTLAMQGRPDDALANFDKAMRLSPQDPEMWVRLSGVALAHAAAGRFEMAVEWAERSLERKADWYLPYAVLAVSHVALGDIEAARAAVRGLSQLNPDFSLAGMRLQLSGADPEFAERAIDGLRKAGMKE
jgi:adenylate cyclase